MKAKTSAKRSTPAVTFLDKVPHDCETGEIRGPHILQTAHNTLQYLQDAHEEAQQIRAALTGEGGPSPSEMPPISLHQLLSRISTDMACLVGELRTIRLALGDQADLAEQNEKAGIGALRR